MWYSAAIGAALVGLGIFLASRLSGAFGFWTLIMGGDRRISTSKAQIGLWTLLVGFMLGYFASRTWFHHEGGLFDGFIPGGNNAGTGSVWGDYIVLLGGPFAALVVANGAYTVKTAQGNLQKSVGSDSQASLTQAITDDTGQPDLVDFQYLLFNLIAIAYVVFGIASTNKLPQIPALLLALSGGAAATYAANKAIQQNKPSIANVTPKLTGPGQTVRIDGANFLPPGGTLPPTVQIGGKPALLQSGWTSQTLTVIVPVGSQVGVTDVVVTTSANVTSDAAAIQVQADTATITGVTPLAASAGANIVIEGTGFYSDLDQATQASVTFNDADPLTVTLQRLGTGIDRIMTKLPDWAEKGDQLKITALTARGVQASCDYVPG